MSVYAFGKKYETLPETLPVFPLDGVLLLPRGMLPLNIFETRYIALVDEAISSHRLIGMLQTRDDGGLYNIGCAGRIVSYNETSDGRYEIVLTGICRFRFDRELDQKNGFRRVVPLWNDYNHDMEPLGTLGVDRAHLNALLKEYFQMNGLTCSWEAVEGASDEKLMTSLAMICPMDAKEKQALLEAGCCKERAQLFLTLLEMAIRGDCSCKH